MLSKPCVLVIGEESFPFHSFEDRRAYFEEILSPVASVETTTDRDHLKDLSDVDVVVDYLTDSRLSEAQFASFDEFLTSGGGYLPIHCAADLMSVAPVDPGDTLNKRDEPISEFREIIGGHFRMHPKRTEFGVSVVDDHPVTTGVEDFRLFDEPYQVEWDASAVTVLATMVHPDLEPYPVLWVKPYGLGRVCYCSLGHTEEAFEHESFRRILRNAVDWLTSES